MQNKKKRIRIPLWASRILNHVPFRRLCKWSAVTGAGLLLVVLAINAHVKASAAPYIIVPEEAVFLDADCILVLGAGIHADNTPSNMLEDRLLQGIDLYNGHVSDRLLMSGDHGRNYYDEVNVMKTYAVERGVPSQCVFMDHAGFSTYESMYRARDVFQVKKLVIVTQRYHLYRAVYVARRLGLDAYGVPSDPRSYFGQTKRDLREVLARNKDFFTSLFKPKPTYLGEAIPVSGDGNATNDREEIQPQTATGSDSTPLHPTPGDH